MEKNKIVTVEDISIIFDALEFLNQAGNMRVLCQRAGTLEFVELPFICDLLPIGKLYDDFEVEYGVDLHQYGRPSRTLHELGLNWEFNIYKRDKQELAMAEWCKEQGIDAVAIGG